MLWEAAAAALLGAVLLWLVLGPLVVPPAYRPRPAEPVEPEETERGAALAALREIEFDRETGKLSDTDYASLKTRYTANALAALRADAAGAGSDRDVEAMIAARVRSLGRTGAPACATCGPRPEADAVFCSTCGRRLEAAHACDRCGHPLPPDSNFCESCGARVAA